MSTILEIRENLINAEKDYKSANSMLDDGGKSLIIAKDKLKLCRADYTDACIQYAEECLFCNKES